MNVRRTVQIIDERLVGVKLGDKVYEARGAYVDPSECLAYLGEKGELKTFKGEVIGTYKITHSWKNPRRSWISDRIYQVEAEVGGVVYTGRSLGIGMLFKGRRKVGQPMIKRDTH